MGEYASKRDYEETQAAYGGGAKAVGPCADNSLQNVINRFYEDLAQAEELLQGVREVRERISGPIPEKMADGRTNATPVGQGGGKVGELLLMHETLSARLRDANIVLKAIFETV